MGAWTYALDFAIIAVAVIATIYLKRAGERSWRRHQRRQAFARLAALSVTLTINVGAISAAFQNAARAAANFEAAMNRTAAALRAGRDDDA